LAVGWAVFVRGGLDGSIPPEGALISRGYWGLLLSLAAAALLAWSCALYVRASKQPGGTLSVPPNMTFETEATRNLLVSRGTAAIFGLAILCALAVFGVRYGDSRIHAWDGKQPLADGFLSSRREAYRLGCSHQPCFAVGERLDGSGKPLAGINEYVLYLTDGVLILAAAAALAGGLVLAASFLTHRARTSLESGPGGA
jgi:hypothetical protein